MCDYENVKVPAPSTPYPDQGLTGACGYSQGIGQPYRPSARDQAEKSAHFHGEEQQKASAAAAFFSSHPEFDEFIRLVRSGAIQF